MQKKIDLTVEESLRFAQESARWDGIVQGVQMAAEHAKQSAVKAILESRQKNGTLTEQANEPAGHAAGSAGEPASAVQPTGAAGEPERTEQQSGLNGHAGLFSGGDASQWFDDAAAND